MRTTAEGLRRLVNGHGGANGGHVGGLKMEQEERRQAVLLALLFQFTLH